MTLQTEARPRLDGVTHSMVNVNGLSMHVAEAGSGTPLLLLHGCPQNWWEWRKVMLPLAEQYRVIAPDLRGAGWTEAPRTGYGREQQVADLTGLLDALGLEEVDVLSHDIGTLATYLLCYRHPERVRAHLALSIPPLYFPLNARLVAGLFRHAWHNILTVPGLGPALLRARNRATLRRMLVHFAKDGSITAEDQQVFFERFDDPDRARAASALYRHFIHRELLRVLRGTYRKTRLTTPTLLLIGADDPNIRPDTAYGYEQYCDELEVRYVPEASHFIAEDRPDAVIAAARAFFGRN